MAKCYDLPRLELEHIVGYSGISNGLHVHPDEQHLIYSLGVTVIIENIETKKQQTLMGHSGNVSCLTVSNSGKYIASGQAIHMGFKADIIIWDYKKKELYARLKLHKVKIEALAFSPNDNYLLSLGGQDDGSVVVWNVNTKNSICGERAQLKSAGNTMAVGYHESNENIFFTCGDRTLRVWDLDVENRKIKPVDVNMGQFNRICKCIQMKGDYLLCGTTTGDILGVNKDTKLLQFHGPGGPNIKKQKNFSCGVTALAHVFDKQMLVGSGAGEVALVTYSLNKKNEWVFEKKRSWLDQSSKDENVAVASIALRGKGHQFFVGMTNSQIYKFNFADFSCELIKTSHFKKVTDIAFPSRTNELFVTSQLGQIRFWLTAAGGKEILRHTIANMTCTSLALTEDGSMVYTAWDDGKIRGFCFAKGKNGLSLKPMFVINDAHSNGVTALACTSDGICIISGGGEGQVRLWNVSCGSNNDNATTSLIHNMMEHKGSVSAIKISKDDKSCVSSSHDGTTIIWDLQSKRRLQIVFANTLFKCVVFNREENQIVTSGTDRKLVYWDKKDGSRIRVLDGSESGSINAMDITEDGSIIATGGDDKILKLWNYDKGEVISVGLGHSGNIQRIKISPDNSSIVSVSDDGAILVWKFPRHLL
ncbi:cilia- and flagella-associated protein 52-like [Pecten maximus]|uniref:cilia- and flagella-associated protein 52-like n=1 Tax=Pecten maximus TaxID=6579 RepID=UPI001458E09D|nr:cilia- and flagella-associated protein 52-like [Pecten maximus]